MKTIPSYPLIPAEAVLVEASAPLIKAVETIDATDARIALVIDENSYVIGSLTDGDVRRGLLKGCTLESPVRDAMHPTPFTLPVGSSREHVLEIMYSNGVKQVPLIHFDGTLAGVAVYDMLAGFIQQELTTPVVIMAGGKGQRLWPITQAVPKPMILLGDKPILELILQQFIRQGFREFYFAINYLGHMIENHFGDGTSFGCHIHYIREDDQLGTAGALSLIEKPFNEPFIVINGDILTNVNFPDMLDYHRANNSVATVCARQHRMEVPFGVIQLQDGQLTTIVEKPVVENLVSAGIYAFNPEVLALVPQNTVVQMPDLLLALVKQNKSVNVFPLKEDWVDIGRPDDLERTKQAYIDQEQSDNIITFPVLQK